jgi:hypothetical protein
MCLAGAGAAIAVEDEQALVDYRVSVQQVREIAFAVRPHPKLGIDYPGVATLFDGTDQLTPMTGATGWDPDELFGGGDPLLPVEAGRHVAVQICSCREAGCGAWAVRIERVNDSVVWSDLRRYVGVFIGVTIEGEPGGGRLVDVPSFAFDAAQYEAAVRAASLDRSWESPNRHVRRLFRDDLSVRAAELGWELLGVGLPAPRCPDFRIRLERGAERLNMHLAPREGAPRDVALAMADEVLRSLFNA